MRTTLLIGLCWTHLLLHAQYSSTSSGGPATSRLESLLQTCQRQAEGSETPTDPPSPALTFRVGINQNTRVQDLHRIRRKAARRLGIDLTFSVVEFDSCGLSTLAVRIGQAGQAYPPVVWRRCAQLGEFGIYEWKYANNRRWFIGYRSNWSDYIPPLMTNRL